MNIKKSQSAIELLVILSFVMVIISLIMYAVGLKSIDIQKESNNKQIDDFAQSILNEIKIMQKVEEGYSRKIPISYIQMKRFNMTLDGNKSYFSIQDTEIYNGISNDLKFYEFSSGLNISLINESGNYSILIYKNKINNNINSLTLN